MGLCIPSFLLTKCQLTWTRQLGLLYWSGWLTLYLTFAAVEVEFISQQTVAKRADRLVGEFPKDRLVQTSL